MHVSLKNRYFTRDVHTFFQIKIFFGHSLPNSLSNDKLSDWSKLKACADKKSNMTENLKPWFLRVCSTSLLKTLREKKKLLVTSNFSFSHSVFYPFGEHSAIFTKFEIVVCIPFQFGRV